MLLCGFDGFMRTGEMLTLKVGQVAFMGKAAVLSLENTKTLRRALLAHTLSEALVIENEIAVSWLRRACKGRAKDAFVMDVSPAVFRKLFKTMVTVLRISGKLSPYSIRRGGATEDWATHQDTGRLLMRGRWTSL